MRLVDFWGFSFSVSIVSILISPQQQRLGDILAKTIVIDTKSKTRLSPSVLENIDPDYQPIFKNAPMLTDAQINEIRDILHP
jgi:RDD family.